MSKIVQWKRGNVTVNDTYTGANGEVTIDTTNWNLRVHDGTTAGGHTIESSSGGTSFSNITVTGTANIANVSIFENNITAVSSGNLYIGTTTYPNTITFSESYDGGVRIGNLIIHDKSIKGSEITLAPFTGNVVSNVYYANSSFYVNTDGQLGYLFDSGTAGFTGLVHYNENGDTVIGIDHDGAQVAKFYDTNTTVLVGNLEIRQDVNVAQALPNVFLQITGNVDSYLQQSIQNLSSDAYASSDVVATADNGTDESYYINMGIASSQYAIGGFEVIGPNDGYLYVAGASYLGPVDGTANLNLGSTTGSTRTWAGQGTLANIVTTVSETGFTVNKGAFVVAANSAPAANNSTGVAGTIAWDSDYIYVCVATDTWKRANLSTW